VTLRRRGWDSHPDGVLKTKNLSHSRFLVIRQIRSKTEIDARIEHAARRLALSASFVGGLEDLHALGALSAAEQIRNR
jgi:hypothetical protein